MPKFYKNGAAVAAAGATSVTPGNAAKVALASLSGSAASFCYGGLVRGATIWPRVLTPAEAAQDAAYWAQDVEDIPLGGGA